MKCSYYAKVERAIDGISIEFPDLPGCISCTFNEEDIYKMAKEALELYLEGFEKDSLPHSKSYISNQDTEYVLIEIDM